MRVVERNITDRQHRYAPPAPRTFARHRALATILAVVGVLGLVVLLAAAVFAIMGLIFWAEGWSSQMVISPAGR